MKIFTTRHALSEFTDLQKSMGKTVGLVPTMGALHQGHLSLINLAQKQTDLVVCSIFVNPTQFNNAGDLEKYPRPLEEDIAMLKQVKCDVLFLPEVDEMYSPSEKWHINLDGLDETLEGAYRPGHYQGVTQIVKKLFDVIKPDYAFFGQKDYQQFLVISKLVKKCRLKIELVMCPIVREDDGLAMSSRNIHLSATERKQALTLYQALMKAKSDFEEKAVSGIKSEAVRFLKNSPGIQLEYFEIADSRTLQPVKSRQQNSIALVAAVVGNTRLIDNIILG